MRSLPSWNAGPAKETILAFVRATTDALSAQFVPVEQRIADVDALPLSPNATSSVGILQCPLDVDSGRSRAPLGRAGIRPSETFLTARRRAEIKTFA